MKPVTKIIKPLLRQELNSLKEKIQMKLTENIFKSQDNKETGEEQ